MALTDQAPTAPRAVEADASPPSAPPASSGWGMVVAAVGLALLWPLLVVVSYGSVDALLGTGEGGVSRPYVERQIPDLVTVEGLGHDGQQFFVIAQHPFDPDGALDHIDTPTYRYRRILFPLVGGVIAPQGGRALVVAFLVLSLAGVALGARALQRMPGGPRWLPLTAAMTPAAITSLSLSLSDVFGAGLALAAVAAATRRRWGFAVGFAVAAGLTRESFLLVALALVLTPGMPRAWRVAVAGIPAAVVGGWALWVGSVIPTDAAEGGAKQVALPLTGWFTGSTDLQTFLMGGVALGLLLAGAWRCRRLAPHVAAVLGLQALLLVCVSELVAFSWVNALRSAAPLLPLAVWALTTRAVVREVDQSPVGRPGAATGGV